MRNVNLILDAMRWASGAKLDPGRLRAARRSALLENHRHYRSTIPAYRTVAERAGLLDDAPFDAVVHELLLPDGIFKSYPQEHLDDRDFGAMSRWLDTIFAGDVPVPDEPIDTIDEWLGWLQARGVNVVYSSGTSGRLSFVPRDEDTWSSFREAPRHYAPGLLARRGLGGPIKSAAARLATRHLSPSTFRALFARVGLRDFDGLFLNFSGGNQGIQIAGRLLGESVRRATYLYPIEISATAIRALTRGPSTALEKDKTEEFLDATVRRKDHNYARLMTAAREAIADGQKLMVFGAPYLVKELCERLLVDRIVLPKGSVVAYGGGWKSFDGERLEEGALMDLIERATGVGRDRIFEAYSMTEICALMVKCDHGRFHVPPYLETVILDEELLPIDGEEATGTFAVLDPFARSYPGFLITGDCVHRSTRPCACGVGGETFLSVGRDSHAEVKGCGGIMATVNA